MGSREFALKGDLSAHDRTTDVRMERAAPSAGLENVMRQWWMPTWNVPEGEARDQRVLGYPVANLVAEPGEIALHGTTTRSSVRRLVGTGWAVGALLQPASGRHLAAAPMTELVDGAETLSPAPGDDDRPKAPAVGSGGPPSSPAEAGERLESLLRQVAALLDDDDLAANELLAVVEGDATLLRIDDLAERLHRSARSLQRLALRNFGIPPAAIIRRRRLQDAAAAVRISPETPLAQIAADYGFSDHAHLTREFALVLGFTPAGFRRGG